VAAELGRDLVGADDHRDRVPAHDRAKSAFQRRISGQLGLALGRDRVDVGGVEARDRPGAGVLRPLEQEGQQLTRPVGAVVFDDRVKCLKPLGRLYGVNVCAGAV
jgi:hypothetical protein